MNPETNNNRIKHYPVAGHLESVLVSAIVAGNEEDVFWALAEQPINSITEAIHNHFTVWNFLVGQMNSLMALRNSMPAILAAGYLDEIRAEYLDDLYFSHADAFIESDSASEAYSRFSGEDILFREAVASSTEFAQHIINCNVNNLRTPEELFDWTLEMRDMIAEAVMEIESDATLDLFYQPPADGFQEIIDDKFMALERAIAGNIIETWQQESL